MAKVTGRKGVCLYTLRHKTHAEGRQILTESSYHRGFSHLMDFVTILKDAFHAKHAFHSVTEP